MEERATTDSPAPSPESLAPAQRFVWGLRYIDDLILRGRDTTGNGTLNERLYALQDPNWNVVAIANTAGTIQERYTYAAYGQPEYRDPDFTLDQNGTDYAWHYLYTGRRLNEETRLYYYRARYYAPTTGRFVSRDPLGAADKNSYAYVTNNPPTFLDSSGSLELPSWPTWPEHIPYLPYLPSLLSGIPVPSMPDVGGIAHRALCATVARVIAEAIREDPFVSKDPYGVEFWERFTSRLGGRTLTGSEMSSVIAASPKARAALRKAKEECFSSVRSAQPLEGEVDCSETLAMPWKTALGNVELLLRYRCESCCLSYTFTLSDDYNWDSWLLSGREWHRTSLGEFVASGFDLVQIATQCTAAGYFDCVYQVWSCFFSGGKRLRFFQ